MRGNTRDNPSICDVCGQKWYRRELRYQVIAAKSTKVLCCPDCWDLDNPQLLVGRIKVTDPNPIYEPRPDINFEVSRGGFGWNPIGGPGLSMIAYPQSVEGPKFVSNSIAYRVPE